MATKRRLVTRGRATVLTHSQKLQHVIGYDFFGGYGDPATRPPGPDEERMREDWIRNREVIRDYSAGRHWPDHPIYSELRFDRGMTHAEAMEAIFIAGHPEA